MRTCTKCGETKPLEDFYKHPNCSGGRMARCKECVKAYQNNRYAKQRVEELAEENSWSWFMRVIMNGGQPVRRTRKLSPMHTKQCHGCLAELPTSRFDIDPKRPERRRFTRCRVCQMTLEPCKIPGCHSCVKRQAS